MLKQIFCCRSERCRHAYLPYGCLLLWLSKRYGVGASPVLRIKPMDGS